MLTDNPHTLGRKTIGRIGIAKTKKAGILAMPESKSLHMIFELISADSELGVYPGTSSARVPVIAKGGSTSRSPSAVSPPRQQPRMQRRMQAFHRVRRGPTRLLRRSKAQMLRRSEAQRACRQEVYNKADLHSRSTADQMSYPTTDTELANACERLHPSGGYDLTTYSSEREVQRLPYKC